MDYEVENEKKSLENIDTFILATGAKPNTDLYDAIEATSPSFKMYKIGDCKEPRMMMEAIHEGFETAYNLDK